MLVVMALTVFPIIIFSFLSNIMLIFGIFKSKKDNNITSLSLAKKMFIFLSVLDILVGMSGLVTTVSTFYQNELLYKAAMVTSLTFQDMGCFVFTAISVLRFIKIVKPFAQLSFHKIAWFLVIGFFKSIGIGIGFMIVNQIAQSGIIHLFMGFVFIINILLILCINMYSYWSLKKQAKCRANVNAAVRTNSHSKHQVHRGKNKDKAIITLLIITFFYVVCVVPMSINSVWIGLSLTGYIDSSRTVDYSYLITYMLMFLNGALNSMIYTLRTKEIRSVYTDLARAVIASIMIRLR